MPASQVQLRIRRVAPALGALPALAALAFAQAVPARTLDRRIARLGTAFSEIAALHELPGGQVLVIEVESIKRAIRLADLTRDTVTEVGRAGDGPREYREPTTLFRVAGDSVLVFDGLGQRTLMITPVGEISRSARLDRRAPDPNRRVRNPPEGIDRDGLIYYGYEQFPMDRAVRQKLRMGGVLRSRQDGSEEILLTPIAIRGEDQQPATANYVPFARKDAWAIRIDGLFARIIADSYTVVWQRGTSEIGRTRLPAAEFAMTDADRKALIEKMAATPVFGIGPGGVQPGPSKSPIVAFLESHPEAFPRRKPPIADVAPAALFDPAGRLWIAREGMAGEPPTYDVVNEATGLVARVQLPRGSRLGAFGRNAVYIVRRDADDLSWLEKFAMPTL